MINRLSAILLLMTSIGTHNVLASQLSAGAASEQIRLDATPGLDDPTKHLVFGVWGRPLTRSSLRPDDHLMATALVLSDGNTTIALVSVDVTNIYGGGVGGQHNWVKEVNDALSSSGHPQIDYLSITATHDHSGPSDTDAGPQIPLVLEAVKKAVANARERLEPAEIAYASGPARSAFSRIVRTSESSASMEQWVYCHGEFSGDQMEALNNHRAAHPLDHVDDTVRVAQVRSISGRPIATIVNYAAHAVTEGDEGILPWNTQVTADYPGILRRSVEEVIGGEVVFLQGAAGDINPWCGLAPNQAGIDAGRGVAGIISDEIINLLRDQPLQFQRDVPLRVRTYQIQPIWSIGEFPVGLGGWHVDRVNVAAIRLANGLTLVTAPGEIFNPYARSLQSLPGYGEVMFAGYTNDAIGYVPDRKLHEKLNPGKEVSPSCSNDLHNDTLKYCPGIMFTPADMGDRIVSVLKDLIVAP